MLGYAGTAVLALGIGAAAGGADSACTAAPAVATTVHSTETVTAPVPDVQPAEAKTVHAPAVTETTTKTVHASAKTKTVKVTPKPKAAFSGDGTYEVGTDIQPGTYVSSTPDSGNCYWARLNGTSGTFNDIIANNNSAGQSVVTIAPTDKLFESSGCNDWSRRRAVGRRSQPSRRKRRRRFCGRERRELTRCPVSGKVCFPDTASAQKVLDEAAVARDLVAGWFGSPAWSVRQEKRIYRCPDCRLWHLTSKK